MQKLQNTIICCTGVLCGVILFVHEFLVMAIAAVILGLVMPAILNYFLPDALSAMKAPDEK